MNQNEKNETEKLLAAMDVSDAGIFTGKQKFSDTQRVKAILPNHYEIKQSEDLRAIRCVSKKGICEGKDNEDNEHWSYIMQALKRNFGKRFIEVYHDTCHCHKDFTIYLRNQQKQK